FCSFQVSVARWSTFPNNEFPLWDASDLKNESDSAPWHHYRTLDADAAFHVHVSFEENIAIPSVPKTDWMWGSHDPDRARTVFLVNANNHQITVHSKAYDYQSGSLRTQTGNNLVLPAHSAKLVAYASSGGPVFNSYDNVTYRFYSDDPFALHLQEPTYGDVMPQECGGSGQLGELGDYVWNDVDIDGIQDGGENGIQGVLVQLLVGNVLLEETTTDSTGFYEFTGLLPANYTVKIADTNFVSGGTLEDWSASPPDQGGDDAVDSDGDVTTHDETVVLGSGEINHTIDFGYYLPASIGDYVWLDIDKDGIQDGTEGGINNVTVELYDSGNSLVGSTTTAGGGAYLFSGLAPGDYYVKFYLPNTNYIFSTQDQGGDDEKDSDADTTTGKTVSTTLSPGENDLSWDAGMYIPSTLVALSSFGVTVSDGQVVVQWSTSSEQNALGFFLERLDESSGKYVRVNADLIPAAIFSTGTVDYETVDADAATTGSLTYRLVEIETTGAQNTYGPYEVTLGGGDVVDDGFSDEMQADEPGSDSGVDVVSLASGDGDVVLRWPSEAGKTYRIEQTIGDSSTEFKVLAAGVPATPPENTAVLVDGADSGVYRVVAEE
ncbi:MAG: SdrD B-like domain-containing protein, partial [Kiritimatiellia bacterium]|nr:SdrD B-like domain-containing protein [Kiritimatiellia bacterium]